MGRARARARAGSCSPEGRRAPGGEPPCSARSGHLRGGLESFARLERRLDRGRCSSCVLKAGARLEPAFPLTLWRDGVHGHALTRQKSAEHLPCAGVEWALGTHRDSQTGDGWAPAGWSSPAGGEVSSVGVWGNRAGRMAQGSCRVASETSRRQADPTSAVPSRPCGPVAPRGGGR